MRGSATREVRMQRTIRTAALTAILLVPLVTSAPADWRALNSAQPAASYTFQGTVRAVDARTGTIELITGVGMSLRIVRMTMAPTTRDRKSTRLNSSHLVISYAVFCLKKKNTNAQGPPRCDPVRLTPPARATGSELA